MAEQNALPRTPSGQIVQPINMSAQSNQPTAVNIPQQQTQVQVQRTKPTHQDLMIQLILLSKDL